MKGMTMRNAGWSVFLAAAFAVWLAGCTTLTGETLGQNLDDASITAEVKAKLATEKASTLTRIGVETVQGTVHLTGIVETAALKERAEAIAWGVRGVRGVVNNLKVQRG